MLETKKRKPRQKKRPKSEGEFDPERYTGKHTVNSRLGDVGYFFKLQFQELRQVLRKAKRIALDTKEEILFKLRK